jgi:SAM-dependent methyltransferase
MGRARSRNFDKIADGYESGRGGDARGASIAADLGPLLRQERVVEVGVGSGVVAGAVQALGFRVFGVDIAEQMLARARDRLGSAVVCADAMNLPFRSRSIPQIVCAWVLHTVADVAAVMSEIRRVLEVTGQCLVVERKPSPGAEDLGARVLRDLQVELGVDVGARDVRNYARIAVEAGLEVREIRASGPHRYETSLAAIATEIETRFVSWMWDVPDDDWRRATSPVLERLHALADLERPIVRTEYQEILVLSAT